MIFDRSFVSSRYVLYSASVISQYFRTVFVSIPSSRAARCFLYPFRLSSCIFTYIVVPTIPATSVVYSSSKYNPWPFIWNIVGIFVCHKPAILVYQLQAGTPDTILNRPVYTSSFVPTLVAAAKPILFGDLGYYWVADREGRSFKRLNELYAPTGQVGFLASERVDGKLILPEAVKVLQQKAS